MRRFDVQGWCDGGVDAVPFQHLRPSRAVDHAGWAVQAMSGQSGVALVVPKGYEACARLLHPLENGVAWAEAAPEYLRPGNGSNPYPFPDLVQRVEGDMGAVLTNALVPVVGAATSTPETCHYGLWVGGGSCTPDRTRSCTSAPRRREIVSRHAAAYESDDGRARRRPHDDRRRSGVEPGQVLQGCQDADVEAATRRASRPQHQPYPAHGLSRDSAAWVFRQ